MAFKKGDRIIFTKEAEECGAVDKAGSFGWVMANQKGTTVMVRPDRPGTIHHACYSFHESFLQKIASITSIK